MKNNLLIDHTKLVAGQKLWDIISGQVIFIELSDNNLIKCTQDGDTYIYYLNGKYSFNDKFPRLYLSNPFEQISEFPKLMEVKINIGWVKRIVLMKNVNNAYLAIDYLEDLSLLDQAKSSSFYHEEKVREIQEPIITEYTLEEIAIKLGVNVNTIRIKK